MSRYGRFLVARSHVHAQVVDEDAEKMRRVWVSIEQRAVADGVEKGAHSPTDGIIITPALSYHAATELRATGTIV